ncbi:hypothetical protein HAU32_09755 [Weissella confusa]|uniref:Uncharacterized protein n=1 Tax=Weissella fermenti TaxID=2987699 RepID=A0ABT6D7G5_9LACO|nr:MULTISPECIES: hypothetical protein [Weissella]MBJ7689247.1 hypothetical protein [Weissella confusa]MCW0927826.1 hypothetical protein [Weissella sp. LMG 11983]MDF9300874.1 hypothetical protein [Weissella sp. BK2]
MYTLGYAILYFLANITIILPYEMVLQNYTNSESGTYFLMLLIVYGVRSVAVWVLPDQIVTVTGPFMNLRSSVAAACIGFMLMPFIESNTKALGVLVAILLGYSSATIWPLFLTYKSEELFRPIKPANLLIDLLAIVIALVILQVVFPMDVSSVLLGLLYFATLFIVPKTDGNNLVADGKAIALVLAVVLLDFIARVGLASPMLNASQTVFEEKLVIGMLLTLSVVVSFLAVLEFGRLRHSELFFATVLRGLVMAYVMLFMPLILTSMIGSENATFITYGLYIVGFEAGGIMKNKLAHKKRLFILGAGFIIGFFPNPVIKLLASLLLATFVGSINHDLNQFHIQNGRRLSFEGITHKYKVSNLGNQFFYIIFIASTCGLAFFGTEYPVKFFQGALSEQTAQLFSIVMNAVTGVVSSWLLFKATKKKLE